LRVVHGCEKNRAARATVFFDQIEEVSFGGCVVGWSR
jgi:hypothetical protein